MKNKKRVYARVLPKTIKLTETYSYEQVISPNPELKRKEEATGKIEVSVPYDGDKYFTRQAIQDVAGQIGTDPSDKDVEALIGHLAMTDYERTNLYELLNQRNHYESVPLLIPVLNETLTKLDQLRDDQFVCVLQYSYLPQFPEVQPIEIEAEVLDEANWKEEGDKQWEELLHQELKEQLEELPIELSLEFEQKLWLGFLEQFSQEELEELSPESWEHYCQEYWEQFSQEELSQEFIKQFWQKREQLSQQYCEKRAKSIKHQEPEDFPRYLRLGILVKLDLPYQERADKWSLKVKQVSINWPTTNSSNTFNLSIDDEEEPTNDKKKIEDKEELTEDQEKTITYNPLNRTLEWSNIKLNKESKATEWGIQSFISKQMWLQINQPGELYQTPRLHGQVEVEISNKLLSGLQVRYYDGLGKLLNDEKLPRLNELTTRLIINFKLDLTEAFEKRTRRPFHKLCFDGVTPKQERIEDIRNALKYRNFQLKIDWSISESPLQHLILAEHREGIDTMKIWVFVEGNNYEIEREDRHGDQIDTRILGSGELRIYMLGEFPGKSHRVLQEMNHLHKELRELFEYL